MKQLPLKTIVEVIHGKIERGVDNLVIGDIVTGTKMAKQGTLVFDLYNGKKINPKNFRKEWSYVIVTDKLANVTGLGENITIVYVANSREAYWEFIDFYRNSFNIPVIGVTGTCGKTTTKEMVKHILSGTYKVTATYKSFNALFHNLDYLLEIDEQTQAAVYEMGVAFPGDLRSSFRYFKPQVGIITNIGIDHLQGFGNLDAYIKAKAEFLECLDDRGTLIINGDDENIKKINFNQFRGNVITFGLSNGLDFQVLNITHEKEKLNFVLRYKNRTYQFYIPGYGEFNVINATAAIVAAFVVGLEIEVAGARLSSFQNVEKHFELNAGINGSVIIDDTWSTNPTSVETALKQLKILSVGKKSIAVLGKMSLLGKQSAYFHARIGEQVADIGIDQLIVLGDGAVEIGLGALNKGMAEAKVIFCKEIDAAYEVLKKSLDEMTIALVKTSMLTSCTDLLKKIIVKKELVME